MIKFPLFGKVIIIGFGLEMRTVVCDYFLWDSIACKVGFCKGYNSVTSCVYYISFPEVTVVIYCDEIGFIDKADKSCATTVHGLGGASDGIGMCNEQKM